MEFKVVLPDGREAVITEKYACIKGSEEKCIALDKDKAEILLEYATHQGWKVEKLVH